MKTIKLFAASAFSLAIIALTPISAYAMGGCAKCFQDCHERFSGDDPASYSFFSACVNACHNDEGTLCQPEV